MKQYQTAWPLAWPIAKSAAEALGLVIGTGVAADALTDESNSESSTLNNVGYSTSINPPLIAAEWVWNDKVKPKVQDVWRFGKQFPVEYEKGVRRFLNTATSRSSYTENPLAQYSMGTGKIPVNGWKRVDQGFVRFNPTTYQPEMYIDEIPIYGQSLNLPVSAIINRLTAAPQVVALPLEGDFYMSKTKKENQSNANPEGTPVTATGDTPTPPSQPDKDPDKKPWWKRLWSRKSSQNTSNKSMTFDDFFHLNQPTSLGNGWWKGAGYGLKIAPYTIPIQIGSQHLKNDGKINRTFYEWIGDLIFPPQSSKPEPEPEQETSNEIEIGDLDDINWNMDHGIRIDSLNMNRQKGER